MATNDLPWTGERYVPQIGGEIELEHLHRYHWAAQFIGGKRVLDIACGEGYGSEILACLAAHVIGVDLSEEAVVHASRKYRRNNLEFVVGSCDRIPVPDACIDLVVSFETIEHHDRHHEMMREIKRILCPNGILIISSPDKYVYSDLPAYKNQFHVKELYAREFEVLLREHFANVDMFGQRVAYGSIIATERTAGFVSFDLAQKSPPAVRGIGRAIYNVAIAADGPLPGLSSGICEQDVAKSTAYQALVQAHAEAGRQVEARDVKLAGLTRAAKQAEEAACARDKKISQLVSDTAKLSQRVAEAEKETIEFQQRLLEAENKMGWAENRIAQMEESLSWKVTSPLRFVRDQLASARWRARRTLSKRSTKVRSRLEGPGGTIASLFDEQYYITLNPEVMASGASPVEHYKEKGWKEGLKPHPLFDPAWYLKQNAEVARAEVEPLHHYATTGWRKGRSPHPLFDVPYYLRQAPDLCELDLEPITHFLRQGARKGLKPHPFFDPIWYVDYNRLSGEENALVHYVTRGWKEGCDPHPSFNVSLYLQANPDLRYTRENPLVHYTRRSPGKAVRLMPDIRAESLRAGTGSSETDVKAIALYLPQFHRIPENDAWWGEGFTEWTNVRRGRPQFWGHYQPHAPHPDVGYYDLADPNVMEKQAEMARQFGIHGFCFYYYWFNGRRLLEMPTDRMLSNGKPDFPFCLCWANENWTRRWDGEEHEVLMGQNHSYDSDERFILDILPALRDRRYIRIAGRPLLAVYRPGLLPDSKAIFAHWREVCRREGLGEIYLAGFNAFDFQDPESFGMDAAVEFPPHRSKVTRSDRQEFPVFNDFEGSIYDYRKLADNFLNHPAGSFTLFRGVMPSWDNTARRQEQGTIWVHSDPQIYCRWLHRAVLQTRRHAKPHERLIFINSWNEWAEGAHLEPDDRYGYAWLNATRLALETGNRIQTSERMSVEPYVLVVSHDAAVAGAQVVALNLLRQWKKRRPFAVRVICVKDGEMREQFEDCFPTLVLSDFAGKAERDSALTGFLDGSPRIIYSSTVVNGPLLAKLGALGSKIITHSHELQKSIERWAPGEIMTATLRHSDFFLGGSSKVAENLANTHGVSRSRLDIVYGFIELWNDEHEPNSAEKAAMRQELGIGSSDIVVFGCGTTDWRKGPDLFLEIARRACLLNARLKFVWIGGDSASLVKEAHGAGLEGRVLFVGARRESRRYYYVGHIFLLSSREDPFPLVALEAANAGLPVVCFEAAGDIPHFVGKECGAVAPYENVLAATEAILRLADDEDLRRTQGAAGRQRATERHGSGSGALQIEALFDRLAPKPDILRAPPLEREPLVSVIVPNYNHEAYLPDRLCSIAEQTHQNLEIILLDDASTDGSRALLQEFSALEHRARFIPNEQNSGSTFKQWAKGLAQARGKYVWIAESDDIAEPTLLESLVGKLEADASLSLAYCQLQIVSPNGELLGSPESWLDEMDSLRWKSDFVNDGIDEIRRFLVVKNTILNASGVVLRNAQGLADLVDESMRLCADWLFWIRLLSRGGVAYLARPLNRWRLSSSNARNRPAGELEWLEGERVLGEAARILRLTESERDRILFDFLRKCWKWRVEAVPLQAGSTPGSLLTGFANESP